MASSAAEEESDASKQQAGDGSLEINQSSSTHWLHAYYDPVASLYSFSSCIALSDLNGDGDHKLIIADLGTGSSNMKLKVFKGTSLMCENTMIDLPTGVVTFHMDMCEPRVPAVGVASGSHIYIYKNLRPYFKFSLPTLDVNSMEQDIWNQAKADRLDIGMLREMLESVRTEIGEGNLTSRSQRFLMLEPEEMEQFAHIHKHFPLKRFTVITCLSTMKKSMSEDDAVSCLVLGTENKTIYVLDPEAFTIIASMVIPGVPVFLNVSGLFDVEYRITVACRNGAIYLLKRGYKQAKLCVELSSQPVGLERIGKNIMIGCMDETMQCFTSKGKKLWSLKMPASIMAMGNMEVHQQGISLLIVAMSNKTINFYLDRFLVNTLNIEEVAVALIYGRFGREDNTLIMVTQGGGLLMKILRRTAQFEAKDQLLGPPAAQNQRLSVPKKTKLFVDQTMRERENSVVMHRMFQQDLYRLRLDVARCYVKSIQTSQTPVSVDPREPIKLTAQVQGLGPTFRLKIFLQNTSANQPSMNLAITFQCDDRIYSLDKNYIPVSLLVPGLQYGFETLVRCITELVVADKIKVFILKPGCNVPIVTANISMPISEAVLNQS